MKPWICCVLVGLLALGPVPAQQKASFELTIDNIMRSEALYGYQPRAVRWSADSSKVYFEWKKYDQAREKPWDTYVVHRDGSGLRKLSEEEAKDAPPLGGVETKDKKREVFVDSGDIYLYDHAAAKRRALTKTSDLESAPRFTKDERHITFTRGGNLYRLALESGEVVQMTDIRTAGAAPAAAPAFGGGFQGRGQGQQGRGGAGTATSDSTPPRGTDSQEFLKKEEKDLLDYVKRRAAQREETEARRKKENPRRPFNVPSGQNVTALLLSPDQTYVIVGLSEPGTGTKNTIVPNYVTESAYTEDINSRNKVGDNQNRTRFGILSVDTGEMKWVDHGLKPVADTSGGQATPDSEEQQGQAQGQGQSQRGQPPQREVSLSAPVWSEDGTKAVLSVRSADNKDRWIMALDPSTGKTRILFTEHDDAWINSGGFGGGALGWMKDDRSVYFTSERSGYAHLYTVAWEGGEPKALTSGAWEVLSVQLSDDKSKFYLTSNEGSPFEQHLWVMAAEGGERTRVTSEAGQYRTTISPDEKSLAVVYSFANKPPELYLMDNRPGAKPAAVTHSPSPEFTAHPWIEPPIARIPARDGVEVPARMYKPKSFRAGGPAVIFVHGAGYAQNVHRWWSSYSREYMFHHLLMERGYMVLDLDYRASAGYGRNWRTAIYRHMGGKDLDDHVDAARWLVKEHGVDAKRIGIYGGSYGGFITLMAMFTQPEVFAAGAALRPVTDWAHYNHGYTSNILNIPQKDSEAYRRSSPIYHAQGLKGALLIAHGMVDTNVHFQDSVRLAQRLIELRKENWEVAVYPVEDHGFVEPSSWADEYKRILKLFETNLKAGLAAPPAKRGRG